MKPKIVVETSLIHLPQIETDNLNQLNMLIKDEAPGNIDLLLLMLKITGESLNLDPSFAEAMKGPDKLKWANAIDGEYNKMLHHKVFELKKRSPGMKTLKSKLVLKMKETENLETYIHKARLVIKGFLQRHGIDYNETYAPVVQMHFLRFMLSYLAMLDYEIHTGDITAAFLNATLKEDINLEILTGIH